MPRYLTRRPPPHPIVAKAVTFVRYLLAVQQKVRSATMSPHKTCRYWKNCVIGMMRRILDLFTNALFGLVYRGGTEQLPPITNLLLLEPAVSLAAQIRARKVKCIDVVESYISRIKEVHPILNVVCEDRFEKAVEEAKEADKLIQSKTYTDEELQVRFPFLGIPFTTKESIAVKGLPHTAGLVSRKGIVSDVDADVVSRMKKAGAIPLAVTNVSELCMWWESNNYIYGRTNNPYKTSRIVGGSSGGEGCLIAAAGSVIGIGSDIGGSIRMPCFFNGIFGHKPTAGTVSNHGQFPKPEGELNDYCIAGPMCRYATDLLPMLKVLAANNPELKLDEKVDLHKLKIFYKEDDGGNPWITRVHPELKQAQRRVLAYFTNTYKMKPKQVDLPKLKYSFQMWGYKMASAEAPSFSSEMAGRQGEVNCLWELAKWLLCCSSHTLPAIGLGIFEKFFHRKPCSRDERCSHFLCMCDDLQRDLQEMLGSDGILLYPSHPEPAPYHNQPIFKPFNIAYTGIFNMLGLPVTQCPLGLSQDGLPLGIQVVGARNMDRLTLAVAVELEKSFGGWYSPSAIL